MSVNVSRPKAQKNKAMSPEKQTDNTLNLGN